MYERVLSLPIFQGITKAQLTSILEKSHFRFAKYKAEDIVVRAGEPSTEVVFLISGELQSETTILDGQMSVMQIFVAPHTLPFYTLFGMNQRYESTLTSVGKSGVMFMDKVDMLNVLQSQKILLVNAMNILSNIAQKKFTNLECYTQSEPVAIFAHWLLSYSDRSSRCSLFDASTATWCRVLHMSADEFKNALAVLITDKVVEYSDEKLKLLDRYALPSYLNAKKD